MANNNETKKRETPTKTRRRFPKGQAPMQTNESGKLNKDCPVWQRKFGNN